MICVKMYYINIQLLVTNGMGAKSMKHFLIYLYKHLATTLTLLVTVVTAVVVNCLPNISVDFLDNFLMAAVIGLNLTFLFDFTRSMDAIDDEITDLKKILPSSRIEMFDSVDQVAEQLTLMVNDGMHEVDIVFYDTKIRTSDPKKVNKMQKFVKFCSENNRIKLRLAFVPAPDSVCQRIENIIEAEKKKSNSFYAYQESSITFASFMVVDGSYISIRTPHKNGSKALYCVVKEDDLCLLYSSWFNILWEEATHVDQTSLSSFIDKYKDIISKDKLDYYRKCAEDLAK